MSNGDIIEQNRVTAGFTIKVPDPDVQYASREAQIFVPLTVPEGSDADDIEMLANQALGIAQRAVAEQLGIESTTEVTEAGVERVTLAVEKAFGGGGANKPAAKKASGPAKKGGGFKGKPKGKPSNAGGRKGPSKTQCGSVVVLNALEDEPLPDWLSDTFDQLVANGDVDPEDNEVWDNRRFSPDFGGNRSANAPWFKTTQDDVVLDWGGEPVGGDD